jgi:hypothetical protein
MSSTNSLTQASDDSAANTAAAKKPTSSDSGQQVAHGIDVAPKRRPPHRAGAHIVVSKTINPTPGENPTLVKRVLELRDELLAEEYDKAPITDTIANRLHIGETRVDRIICRSAKAAEVCYATACEIARNLPGMCEESGREVWE